MKRCCKCQQEYPATLHYFHRETKSPDGFHARCKNCRCSTKRHTVPKGYKRCKECKQVLPATHEYFTLSSTEKYGLCGTCRACRKQKNGQKFGKYPPDGTIKTCSICEKPYPATLEYFQSDGSKPDHLRAICKKCISSRRTSEEGRAKSKVLSHLRRSRQKMNTGKHTVQDIEAQYQRQKGKCYYCHKKLTKYHVDHVMPLSRGGSNGPDNLVIACQRCNNRKAFRLPHEWPEGGRLL